MAPRLAAHPRGAMITLAALVLAVHVLVIGFNLFGLVAIPLGARRGWAFVHRPAWRLLHLASLFVTALQAALGQACFLTIWEESLKAGDASPEPLIMRWVNSLIYWPLPAWVFAAIYLLILAYALILVRLVPLRRRPAAIAKVP